MIAIHHTVGSFSEKWIEYCELNNISYKLVNCYSSDIISEINSCEGLMWHWLHTDYKAQLFARQLIVSIQNIGIPVFPNIHTCWHFDDKVGQKYLFESIKVPFINTQIFYDEPSALEWVNNTTFPKVAKLRGGAGSVNVKLLNTKSEAKKYMNKIFSKGFGINRYSTFLDRIWHFKRDKTLKSFLNISKGIGRIIFPNRFKLKLMIEKNYLYVQDFIPNNDCDIRVVTIGNRAFAIKRMVRKDDFRASGSGHIIYDPDQIPTECISLSFKISEKLKLQSAAYDFVFDNSQALLIEVSYSFLNSGYIKCPGYWDRNLNWYSQNFVPEYFIIEDFITLINNRSS